jgi:hypothetical protein
LLKYNQQAAGGMLNAVKKSPARVIETITEPVSLQRRLTALWHIPHRLRNCLGAALPLKTGAGARR